MLPRHYVTFTLFMSLFSTLIANIFDRYPNFPRFPMIIIAVLSVLRLSLFALSQSHIFKNSGINSCLISRSFLTTFDKTVSSAHKEMFDVLVVLGKSLKYRINSRGPNTEPCETPHVSDFCEDTFSLTRQHCVR